MNDRVLAAVTGWSQEQRDQAAEWAAAVHVQASDNDDVVVPGKPVHVEELEGILAEAE